MSIDRLNVSPHASRSPLRGIRPAVAVPIGVPVEPGWGGGIVRRTPAWCQAIDLWCSARLRPISEAAARPAAGGFGCSARLQSISVAAARLAAGGFAGALVRCRLPSACNLIRMRARLDAAGGPARVPPRSGPLVRPIPLIPFSEADVTRLPVGSAGGSSGSAWRVRKIRRRARGSARGVVERDALRWPCQTRCNALRQRLGRPLAGGPVAAHPGRTLTWSRTRPWERT